MKVTVNGKQKGLKYGATLADAIKGEPYIEGSDIAGQLSTEKVTEVSNDFALLTQRGEMVVHLYDTEDAKRFRAAIRSIEGVNLRWSTREVLAFGSFATDIREDRSSGSFKRYEVFFSLGGNDNQTTYLMIARKPVEKVTGCGGGKIGKITVGRHLMDVLKENERIIGIHPVVSETSRENVAVTKDMGYPLGDGYSVETRVLVKLDHSSPKSAEQLLILASKGYIDVSEATGTFMGCRDDMDVDMEPEDSGVRDAGTVAVRNTGAGEGHVLFYRERRQLSPSINIAGRVAGGMAIVSRASAGDRIAVETDPPRALAVGMTQKDGEAFLARFGIKVRRTGDASDRAVIADQVPEETMQALKDGEVEVFGVPKESILRVQVTTGDAATAHYFRKVTGLSHKPVGKLKVQLSMPGSPMCTFYGDDARSQDLVPQDDLFKKCRKGDIGITNQSRPYHGLIGIRLTDSKQYGPTGEEPEGTNMLGRYIGDLSVLETLDDESTVYIMEDKQ